MGSGLIPSLVQVEDIGPDIRKRDRSSSPESDVPKSDASTEIIESEDDFNLEPDSTTKEERKQEENGFPKNKENNSKHLSKRVREDNVEIEKEAIFTIANWWKCKHCTHSPRFLETFYINNHVAAEDITNKEKREKERIEEECKELVDTSYVLYGDEEDCGFDDLEKDRFENSKALLKLCEALHARRVHLNEYIHVFEGITRTVNTIVRMDIELNRRSKSSEARATFEIESVDAVPGGSSAPGQVPKGVKSTAEPNP